MPRRVSAAGLLLLTAALSGGTGCARRPPTWFRMDGKASSPKPRQLIFTRIEMQKTPRDDSWLFCFEARTKKRSDTFYVPGKRYSESPVITLDVGLIGVREGEPVDVAVRMDRDESDICSDRAEDFVKFRLPVSPPPGGSLVIVPHPRWSFLLHWSVEDMPPRAK